MSMTPAAGAAGADIQTVAPPRGLWPRLEAYFSRLSTRNNFWHRVCSLIWLPYAWRSGISMKRLSTGRFTAILPFKRVNRNWYNAMAGAALLGNSDLQGSQLSIPSPLLWTCRLRRRQSRHAAQTDRRFQTGRRRVQHRSHYERLPDSRQERSTASSRPLQDDFPLRSKGSSAKPQQQEGAEAPQTYRLAP